MQAVPRMTGDLAKDPYYRWLNNWFLALQLPLAACCSGSAASPAPAAGPWCSGASPCAWCLFITSPGW